MCSCRLFSLRTSPITLPILPPPNHMASPGAWSTKAHLWLLPRSWFSALSALDTITICNDISAVSPVASEPSMTKPSLFCSLLAKVEGLSMGEKEGRRSLSLNSRLRFFYLSAFSAFLLTHLGGISNLTQPEHWNPSVLPASLNDNSFFACSSQNPQCPTGTWPLSVPSTAALWTRLPWSLT